MKLHAFAAPLLTAAILAGCASAPPAPEAAATPEAAIAQRAQARWDYLLADDLNQAYNYLTPSYRSLKTVADYKNTFGNGAKWHSAKLNKVICTTHEKCEASIAISVMVLKRKEPVQTIITETWIKEDSSWWFYQK